MRREETTLWPAVADARDLERLKGQPDALRPGVAAIAARHRWQGGPLEPFRDGSLPVVALPGDVVLKLYPPPYLDDHRTEARALELVRGHIAAPELLASGEIDGWRYVGMTRLPGEPLAAVWHRLAPRDWLQLADEIGGWLALLHALPCDGPAPPGQPWPGFIAARQASVVEDQRRRGLGEPWLSRIEPFLAEVDVPIARPLVLLHTEVSREHVFVEPRGDRFRLTGVVDFEPAMVGPREYEFASVGVFTSCGDGEFLRRLLLGYGFAPAQLDHELQRTFLAHLLLHRFSNLAGYLRRMPPRDGVASLDALAAQWWGFGPS